MFGAYDRGYDEGYKDGKLVGFNEGINEAKRLISQSPLLDGTTTEELYQEVEKLKKK